MALSIGLSAVALFCSSRAEADQGFTYAQIECMPETDYLTLSTQFIWDVNPKGFRRDRTLALVEPYALEARPFICRVKGRTIKITADTKRAAGPKDQCQSQLGGYNVRISLDGEIIDTLRQVDCDGRRYFFDILVDSDFPAPRKEHAVFFNHCIYDQQDERGPADHGASGWYTQASSNGRLSCVLKASSSK